MKSFGWLARALVFLAFLLHPASVDASDPESAWWFSFAGPLPHWQEGLPVGNGQIGAQSWGTGQQLFLTLDRGDVRDLRYQNNTASGYTYRRLQELVQTGRTDLIQKEMSPDTSPTADFTPTHLPVGRLRIELPNNTTVERAELDMQHAEVRWNLRVDGKPVIFRTFACAEPSVLVAILEGLPAEKPKITLQGLLEIPEIQSVLIDIQKSLGHELGYEKPKHGGNGDYFWITQPIPGSGNVATAGRVDERAGMWQLLLTILPQDEPDPLGSARRTLEAAYQLGVSQLEVRHLAWWQKRWARSSVQLPDQKLERLWINGLYKLASSSTVSVPANLQGLWPPDGEFPPFRGDYHGDINVQETYWPAYVAINWI